MSVKGGPNIVTDGLVFNLDAAGAISNKTYPINGLSVEYLIVAGGGGGGGVIGGGGGAGGLLNGFTKATIASGDYTVVVGAGGAGGTGWNTGSQDGKLGANSTAFSLTANGGGGGSHYCCNTTSSNRNGGSGGGGAYGSANGGTGIAGQGNNGGNAGTSNVGAGGGGAGSAGSNANTSLGKGGHGGIGKYFGNTLGTSVGYNGWFADGGGGGVRYNRIRGLGSNGAGDGGNHNADTLTAGITNAAINTGSGGGGAGYSSGSGSIIGGNGGSGVVIIRYKGSQKASGGDSIFNYRGFTVHVFTSSGTFTVGGRVGGLSTSKIVGTLNNMGSSNYSSANKGYFTFDGSNEYITFPLNNSSGDWVHSIVFWMYLNSNQSAISSRVDPFQIGSVNGYSQYSAVDINNNNFNWYFYSNDTRINTNIFSGQQWYHIGLTYSGGGATSSTKKFYLNSVYTPWNFTSGAVYGNNLAIAGNTTLTIGRDTPRTTAYFPGRIAAFRIYNRALSANEVEQNYNATKGRFGL